MRSMKAVMAPRIAAATTKAEFGVGRAVIGSVAAPNPPVPVRGACVPRPARHTRGASIVSIQHVGLNRPD